jgi:hypothetical protein
MPPPAAPPAGRPDYEPVPPPTHGPAGDDARRLFDELAGGPAPAGSSWNPAPAPAPAEESSIFPATGIPSYSPTPPAAAAPPSADVEQSAPAADEPTRRGGRGHVDRDDRPDRSGASRLLPLLLALALLLGGGFLLKSLLSGDDADDDVVTPPVRRTVAASASAGASASSVATPTPRQTYSQAQIDDSLKDPHFRHGYDAGKRKAAAGPVKDPEATCTAMAYAERAGGYPWGAHDRQGCLVGITT